MSDIGQIVSACGETCGCASPRRSEFSAPARRSLPLSVSSSHTRHPIGQVRIPTGSFLMGDSSGDLNTGDGEVPVHVVEVTGFEIDATTVANEAFAAFTKATDYVTEAEVFGFSAVFHLTVAAPADDVMGSYPQTPWWLGVRGANWRHPGGSLSSIEGRGGPSCRSRQPQRRRRVLCMGGPSPPDRSAMGASRTRRLGVDEVSLGGRRTSRRRVACKHMAGRVPGPQHA